MVFVPTHPLDVVPRRRLMAAIALVDLSRSAALGDFSIGLTRDGLRDHLKVLHVVTRRRLVALRTIKRLGRGMLESRNRPCRSGMTIRALGTEQADVRVGRRVTRLAIQSHLERTEPRMTADG